MAESIPSQINFSQLLSHTFPGIFTTISIIMIIDIIFDHENVNRVFQIGIIFENWITFMGTLGGLVFFGTIIGVIIDSIHHVIVDEFIDVVKTSEEKPIKNIINIRNDKINNEINDTNNNINNINNKLNNKINNINNEIDNINNEINGINNNIKNNMEKIINNLKKIISKIIKKIVYFIHNIIMWTIYGEDDPIKEIKNDEDKFFGDLKNGNGFSVYYFIGFLPLERFQFLIDNHYSYVEFGFNLSISFLFSSIIYPIFIIKCGYDLQIALFIGLIMFSLSLLGFRSAVKLYINYRKIQLNLIKGAIKHRNDVIKYGKL